MKPRTLSRIIIVLMMLFGISMIAYPTVSDWVNSYTQSRAIATYDEAVENLDNDSYQELLDLAQTFNGELLKVSPSFTGKYSNDLKDEYGKLLDISGKGVIGYIDIPSVGIHLAIYHGTSDEVLGVGVGHLEGSSLPIGGESTHAVLSGHTGLPSARLFTDIDQLVEGDIFTLHILGDVLTYEVDQIEVVLPSELENLKIEEGKDLVTLVTCTPYGVNSHRLLIRGHRITTTYEEVEESVVEEILNNPISPLVFIIGGIGIATLLIILFIKWKQKNDENNKPKLPPLPRKLPPLPKRKRIPNLPGQIRR